MTNQEAIDIIKTAIAEVEWDYPMDYAAAFDMAVEALAKDNNVPGNGWISVNDRLPEQSGKYLIVAVELGRIKHVTTTMFGTFFYMTGRMAHWKVTHWMALPEPPKEG